MQKYIRSALLGSVAALILAACGGETGSHSAPAASGNNHAANTTAKTVVVGLDDNFPPMGFRDDKNE